MRLFFNWALCGPDISPREEETIKVYPRANTKLASVAKEVGLRLLKADILISFS